MPLQETPDINFKPEELNSSYKPIPIIDWINKVGKRILITVQAIILILLAINFFFSRSLNNLTEQFNSLKERTQSTEKVALLNDYKDLQQKILEIEGIQKNRIDWTSRIKNLGEKIPADLLVERYDFAPDSLILKATVKSVQGFALFIGKLREDSEIKAITLTKSDYNNKTKDFSFEMLINL